MKLAERRQDEEGLSSTKYTLESVEMCPLYTHIKVKVNVKDVLDTAPTYMATFVKAYFDNFNKPGFPLNIFA